MKKNIKYMKYIVYLIVSIFMILVLSKSTSPLYDGSYTIDSGLFIVVGKAIIRGYIPYVDLFDHKGPIIFLINALGVLINEDIGIVLLQIINCYITILFLDKLINLYEKRNKKKNITLLITLFFYTIFFGEGNFTEEWCLSLITISTYIISKGLINNNFKKIHYFIMGAIFAFISLTRLNNAAIVASFGVFQFLNLIISKKYNELFKFILYFVLGLLVIYIPIIILFIRWNALYDMIYATFVFNFLYSIKGAFNPGIFLIKIFGIIPLLYMIYIIKNSTLNHNLKNYLYISIFFNAVCVSLGYSYLHYYIILIPLIAILITQIKRFLIFSNNFIFSVVKMLILVFSIMFYICFLEFEINFNKTNYDSKFIEESDVKDIESHLKNKEAVLCYDIPSRIYLLLDINPCYKYFDFQSWYIYNVNKVQDEITEYLKKGNIKYIITFTGNKTEVLSDYRLIYKNKSLDLYEINS